MVLVGCFTILFYGLPSMVHNGEVSREQRTLTVTVTSQSEENFQQRVNNGASELIVDMADETHRRGAGPTPFDLLYGAWGACTNMTIQVYARRKGWPLRAVETVFEETPAGREMRIEKQIRVWGELSGEQVAQLKQVAEKCPVNLFIMQQRGAQQVTASIHHVQS